jgi:hypothetical protein
MASLIDQLRNDDTRTRLGLRFEALADEVFQVIRWILIVGFVSFLAKETGLWVFDVLNWGLTALLFAAIASRFLLRPEIRLVPHPENRVQARVQTLLNMMLCLALCICVLWGVQHVTDAAATYRMR